MRLSFDVTPIIKELPSLFFDSFVAHVKQRCAWVGWKYAVSQVAILWLGWSGSNKNLHVDPEHTSDVKLDFILIPTLIKISGTSQKVKLQCILNKIDTHRFWKIHLWIFEIVNLLLKFWLSIVIMKILAFYLLSDFLINTSIFRIDNQKFHQEKSLYVSRFHIKESLKKTSRTEFKRCSQYKVEIS